jgi:hypothetical protein
MRHGCGLRLDDDLDGALEQGIFVGIEVLVVLVGLLRARRLEQRLVEVLAALRPALLDD